MAKQTINTTPINSGLGTPLNESFDICNDNFTELYDLIQDDKFVIVDSKSKLPAPVSNVITLLDDVTYYFTGIVDLTGDRLVGGQNTTILGTSSENAIITSTGLGAGVALLTTTYTTPIRHVAFNDVDTALDIDGLGNNAAMDWTGVNFVNVPNIGVVKDVSNFIFSKGAFLNSKGMEFDGTIGTIGMDNSLFSGDGLAGDIIEVLSTCTVTRRFRIIYSSVVAFGSTVGVTVDASATIGNEDFILDTINFSGGGTYLGGLDHTSNMSLFTLCNGITNSSEISQYYMNGNATTTVITTVDVAEKVLGTTTNATVTQKFTHTDNRATYVGSVTRFFKVLATLSVESGNNNQIGCYIFKNGIELTESEVYGTTNGSGRAENVAIQTLVELTTNDYIEIYVENSTSTQNITVTDLNVIID